MDTGDVEKEDNQGKEICSYALREVGSSTYLDVVMSAAGSFWRPMFMAH